MSEVKLVVRDARRSIYAHSHGGFADSVIAALSADPETIEELDVAVERFIAPSEWSYFHGFRNGIDDEPYDAGLVVVDLAARLVLCDSTYSTPSQRGCVPYHDGRSATNIDLGYTLADEWMITSDAMSWQSIAEKRRHARLAQPPLDARTVLYGDPLLEFIARECFAAFRDRPTVAKEDYHDPEYQQEYELVRHIHARWLMTSRKELRDRNPRDVMLSQRDHLGHDYQDRKHQWSFVGRPARTVDPESTAYRFGGFGTHELVVYYDMVRELLWCSRRSVEEFVAGEVGRLAAWREEWLELPYAETTGRSARSIIENERLRLPEALTRAEMIIDDDCPLCQMQADMDAPTFWNLDGSGMDHEFVFSIYHDTQEQWDKEEREYEQYSRRCDEERAEQKRMGIEHPKLESDVSERGWFDYSIQTRLFSIGAELCRIIVALREKTPDHALVERLNRAFGNLTETAQSRDAEMAEALVEPVIQSFIDGLEDAATARPDLAVKCSRLVDCLGRFLEPVPEPGGAPDEMDDLPF